MILGIKIEKIIRGESIIEDQRGYLEEKLVRKEERGSKERIRGPRPEHGKIPTFQRRERSQKMCD